MAEPLRRWPVLLVVIAAMQGTTTAQAKVTTIAEIGSAPGQVHKPYGIAVDAAGNAVVGEAANARVQKFSRAGASLLTFGGPGSGPGKLGEGDTDRIQLAIGPQGDYFVAGSGTGSIHRYRADGSFVTSWVHSAFPGANGITALASGDVYLLAGSEIVRYTADGAYVQHWTVAGEPSGTIDLTGADDALYVLAAGASDSRYVVRYDGGGAEVARWYGKPFDFRGPTPLYGATGIGMAANGNVLTVGGSGIDLFGPTGTELGRWPPWSGQGGPPNEQCGLFRSSHPASTMNIGAALDVAADREGNIWLSAQESRILRIDLEPSAVLDWGPYFGGYPLDAGTLMRFDASPSAVPFQAPTRFEWDFDADGQFELDTGATPSATHVYHEPGTYRATVRVTGPGGLVSTRSQTLAFAAWRPQLYPGIAITDRDATLTLQQSTFCSPIERYEWDLDGDGVFERDSGVTNSIAARFAKPGRAKFGVRVTRAGGHADEAYSYQDVYPAPPRGPVGVSINGGERYTNSRDVQLGLVWRRWTGDAQASNDGGFKDGKKVELASFVPWRLEDTGPTRFPRVVYVRFGATRYGGPPVTFQDDIILDQTRPVVTLAETVEAPAAAAAARRYRLRIGARDSVSGVADMQVATKRRHRGRWRKFARRTSIRTAAAGAFVRVRDHAGNKSRWRRVDL
ncbi:MAG: hypothetical protein QOJ22_747 [Thermoleophilaceae bacterium]|jgi:hypothetical protein|nr:hypothetical protein [Thermoleophilaceae bacterium]